MDLANSPMFGILRRRMAWLTQRQDVLARNIANADTPEFRPSDLKKMDLGAAVGEKSKFAVDVQITNERHIVKNSRHREFEEKEQRKSFETAPAGNSVILEEQLGKLNETQVNHSLITELYKKHLSMLRLAGTGNR